MEKFLDNTPVPWVKVTDPSTGKVYYSTATHEYADRNGPDPTFLQNVIIEPTGSGATDTGSLLTSASFRDPDLTFTKGDGSTFDVNISTLTALSASYALTASYALSTLAISGTTNYIPKFATTTTLGNSVMFESGSNIGIGTTDPQFKIHLSSSTANNKIVGTDPYASNSPMLLGHGYSGFGGTPSNITAKIAFTNDALAGYTGDAIVFYTTQPVINPTNNDVSTERMRIGSDGGVNISGSFTSSLQQNYVWLGNTSNRNTPVSLSTLAISGSFYTTGSFGFYGAFCSTASQTNPVRNISRSMNLETTEHSNGVRIESGSKITVVNPGTYNLQFSAQLEKTTNGTDTIYIWFKKNGNNVARSATSIDILKQAGGGGRQVAAWNYIDTYNAGDYIEIVWQSDDTDILLAYDPPSGNIPSIPSVIVTLNQIS